MPADLTNAPAVDDQLRVQERQLATIFNSAHDMMMFVKVEPGVLFRVVSVNREYLNKARSVGFVFTAEDFVGKTCDEVMALFGFGAAAAAGIRALYQQVIETRQVLAYDEDKRGPAGVFHGRTTITPLLDETGACAFVLYATQDVTAWKQAEQERARSEQTLRAILDHSFQFIGLLDPAGRLLRPNQPSLDAVGARMEDVVGRYFWETPWWTHSPAEQARLREAVGRAAQGEFVRYETTHPTADGRMLTIDFSLKPVRDEQGTVIALIPEGRDITERKGAEQALHDSEEKFASAFRLNPSAMSIASIEDGRYLEINQGHQEIFGYPPAEIIGRTPAEIGLLVDPSVTAAALVQLRATGRVRDLTVTVRTRSGELRTILNSAELIRIGGRECALLTSRDITERIHAEQALHESEEKFAKIFRASPDAMSVHELETGRYVDVNEGFLCLFGCSRDEVIGRTPVELGLWAERGERRGFVERLRADGSVRNHTVTVRLKDGRQRVCELSAERFDIGGRPHNVTVLKDITDQLAAERNLRESEDKFAKAFIASPQPLIITELATGRYIDVNLGFEQVTGYTREEVIGRTSLEVGIWDNLDDRKELFRRLEQDTMVRDMEIVFRKRNGERITTRCSCECIDLAGRPCMLSAIEDITEKRRAEERKAGLEAQMRQNQKLEALGTLAGGIAHDFNNILTAIIVNQELAQMDLDDGGDPRRRLQEIGLASNRAKELVRQILTFSRQQPHERLRQHLQMIVREALGLVRASIPSTIEIVQDLAPDAPPVLADAGQIHQVVMNLCTNAAHAMRDRAGRLTVRLAPRGLDETACRARPGLRPGNYAHLVIADTGHGMDAAVLARIFEPFFTTKGPGEGTGLGLPMVHGIMRDHEGAIFVESAPGRGTTFDLYFPAAEEPAAPPSVTMAQIVPGRNERVLVVDDEEAIGQAVGAMLRRIGYRVEVYSDPREALECIRARPSEFNLLLTDRTMPQLSGPELISRAREWWPGLPALLMSGMSSPAPRDGGDDPGGYGLLEKPIDIIDLSRTVRRIIDSSHSS